MPRAGNTLNFRTVVSSIVCLLTLILSLPAVAADDVKPNLPTLFIVGDSTVKNGTKGQQGWGERIGEHFDRSRINVVNRAIGGRSSRTFINDGRWDQVLADAKGGDYVLIQFGHNDGGPLDDASRARGTLRGTGEETREIDNPITKKHEVVHTYGWYLRKYVADARAKGMTPILCSPVPHVPKETIATDPPAPAGYELWAGEVAAAQKVPFVDLHDRIQRRYAGMEPSAVKSKYFTEADNTHTNRDGAALNAEVVVEGIRQLKGCALSSYLLSPSHGADIAPAR
jgi:rhamnogalacturonan acetylesterase